MLKVAVCGASGYAGAELLRILASHNKVKVTSVTSEKSAGKKVADLFPHLHQYEHLIYEPLDPEKILSKADLFFMSLPHAASQEPVETLVRNKKKVIDLSADYRLHNADTYKDWYHVPHKFPSMLREAVYGLPERYRKNIAKAAFVANPGCYPTSAILGLYPALKKAIIDSGSVIVDSKSGTTGAGRQSDTTFSYCEVNEGLKAYGIGRHRHTPEIEQELSLIAGKNIKINFTPHLIPLDRGILSTLYARLKKEIDTTEVQKIYKETYAGEPFVRVLAEGKLPNVKNVRGTNLCEIGLVVNKRTNTLIVVSAIDNLVKGAAGQAVQNMNIMMGFEEETALKAIALFP